MPIGLPADAATLRKYSTWFILYGVRDDPARLVRDRRARRRHAGASSSPIGWLLLFGGVFGLIAVYLRRAAPRPASGGTCSPPIVYILAGLALLTRPVSGIITLTIILAAYLLAGGIIRIMLAIGYRKRNSGRLGLDAVQRHGRHRARADHPLRHARGRRPGCWACSSASTC